MPRPFVTDNMTLALRRMADAEAAELFEDAEIVCSGRDCWIGDHPVASRTVDRLLTAFAISDVSEGAKTRRYVINGTGRAILADPLVAEEVMKAALTGGAFDAEGKRLSGPGQEDAPKS